MSSNFRTLVSDESDVDAILIMVGWFEVLLGVVTTEDVGNISRLPLLGGADYSIEKESTIKDKQESK